VATIQGPSLDDLAKCVHCGLCSQSCPTYLETGLETESPRGRLYLMRARAEGRIEATNNFMSHIELCLLCRNCEAVCPSGVPYGRIMQAERASVLAGRKQSVGERLLRWLVFQYLLREPARLRPFVATLRFYQQSGLQRIVRVLLPGKLKQMDAMLPALSRDFFGDRPTRVAAGPLPPGGGETERGGAVGSTERKVALFGGCVMPYLYGGVNAATARVLARNGYEVSVVPGATCCGSLHEHSGELETARDLARRNIDAFETAEAVVINAAGCGATLKEYGELLRDDPEYAERAEAFGHKVCDVSEFLAKAEIEPPKGSLPLKVTYQDSCHLAHAQRITLQPRAILRSIPGLDLVEMHTPDQCCGSAGIYNITKAEFSQRLLETKMEDVASTGAEVIATANPGCMLQLTLGLQRSGLPGRVVHVVELLDEAYRAEEEMR
jgi:glycolate oxidase iron-sulfur subunit